MKAREPSEEIRRLFADTRGASAVEYGLIVAVVMLAIFASLSNIGISLQNLAYSIADQLSAASR